MLAPRRTAAQVGLVLLMALCAAATIAFAGNQAVAAFAISTLGQLCAGALFAWRG